MGQKNDCLGCARYFKCVKPKKAAGYICGKFKEIKITDFSDLYGDSPLLVPEGADSDSIIEVHSSLPGDELKMAEMLEEVLNSRSPVPTDLRVDDRDIKEFPNFYSFATSKNGLGYETLWARQIWVSAMLFGEICPRCSMKGWSSIKNIPVDMPHYDVLEHIQLMEYGVCPNCKRRKHRFFERDKLNVYVELNLCLGQRASKSTMTQMFSAYHTHKLLKLQRPTVAYRLLPDSILSMTFVGLTFAKAVSLLWNPIANMMRNSKWFQSYHSMLNHYSNKYGEELFKFQEQMVQYRHRNLVMYPSGPNKRTLRGDNRVGFGVDEIGWFPNDVDSDERERAGADEVYQSLDRSCSTVRQAALRRLAEGYDNIPTALAFLISSPASQRDKIMMLVKANAASRDALALHLPTWEMNPDITRDSKVIVKAYRDNPSKAERDFGANPPLNDSPFFEKSPALQKIFGPAPNKITYKYVTKTVGVEGNQSKMRWAELLTAVTTGLIPQSLLSLDAGYSDNSFSGTVQHLEVRQGRAAYITDAVFEIAPNKGKNVINFSEVHARMLDPIIKKFNVQAVVTDRWQGKKFLHDIQRKYPNMYVTEYSLTYDDMLNLRDYMIDQERSIYLPRMEITPDQIEKLDITTGYPHCFKYMPLAHLYFQLLTITDQGNAINKGMNLTDDVWRSYALGMAFMLDEAFVKQYLGGAAMQGRSAGLGVMAGHSSGLIVDTSGRAHRPVSGGTPVQGTKSIGVIAPRRPNRGV